MHDDAVVSKKNTKYLHKELSAVGAHNMLIRVDDGVELVQAAVLGKES